MFRSALRATAVVVALAVSALAAGTAQAQDCTGTDLIAALPPDEAASLHARADAVPFARGNLWQATRAGQQVTLFGTYHLDDPRHDALIGALRPRLEAAAILLVEAGPLEQAQLMRELARDPGLILLPDGSSLPDLMEPETWSALSDALSARRIPPFMGARMQPWYLAAMLAIPPCMTAGLAAGAKPDGLDSRILRLAEQSGLPVRALEPWNTAFGVFREMPMEQQIDMIRSTLALGASEDQIATLANAYFAGESRLIWEFQRHVSLSLPGATPDEVDADLARMEAGLVTARNRAWIPVIEDAAGTGPVFAAFGALHLPGETGVLNLLQQDGWTITPLP